MPTDTTLKTDIRNNPTRHSTRINKPPKYLQDYVCNNTHHWCNLISYESFAKDIVVCPSRNLQEPKNYKEASEDPNWMEAMNKELSVLALNNTWDIVDLPHGKKPVGCKWVFKIKLKSDGTLERYKARLVAKGYTQEYSLDYSETFSLVIKMTTIRCILAIASSHNWSVFQLDVNNAFLHGDLHEDVYMKLPDGFSAPSTKVCKLKKSIYGLKQSSRQWFTRLTTELVHQGFQQSKYDYSLFTRRQDHQLIIVVVYVDIILITRASVSQIQGLKDHLHKIFSIKDLGLVNFFLGLEIQHLQEGIVLHQHKFTNELLRDSGLTTFKKVATPLPLGLKLTSDFSPPFHDPTTYRSLVGKLNFLTNTRLDICFTVQSLSQHMQQPSMAHYDALVHTLNYVQ